MSIPPEHGSLRYPVHQNLKQTHTHTQTELQASLLVLFSTVSYSILLQVTIRVTCSLTSAGGHGLNTSQLARIGESQFSNDKALGALLGVHNVRLRNIRADTKRQYSTVHVFVHFRSSAKLRSLVLLEYAYSAGRCFRFGSIPFHWRGLRHPQTKPNAVLEQQECL